MTETDQSAWLIGQRDYPVGALIDESVTYTLNVRDDDEDGRWMGPFGGSKADRDEMTRVQAFRATDHPTERRRVIRRVVQYWVDEIEGDGEGETSVAELVARNKANTDRLIAEKDAQAETTS